MSIQAHRPEWARHLPHGNEILLLADCTVESPHRASASTLLSRTALGASLATWPVLWGLEILAQAAACLPVRGRMDGLRKGYLVKADRIRYSVEQLPAEAWLGIEVERKSESSSGLNAGEGRIFLQDEPGMALFEARFFLWNQGK